MEQQQQHSRTKDIPDVDNRVCTSDDDDDAPERSTTKHV